MKIELVNSKQIRANKETLWKALVDEFNDVSEWASNVSSSTENKSLSTRLPDGELVCGRNCKVAGFGNTSEKIVILDKKRGIFAYSVKSDKIPSFVEDVQNHWKIDEISKSECNVTSSITATARGTRGRLIAPLLKINMNKAIKTVLVDLDRHINTQSQLNGS
jgi:hypothetical protein